MKKDKTKKNKKKPSLVKATKTKTPEMRRHTAQMDGGELPLKEFRIHLEGEANQDSLHKFIADNGNEMDSVENWMRELIFKSVDPNQFNIHSLSVELNYI